MDVALTIPTVSHAIQASVAPVFLMTGVGAILNVLTNRLGRIVDRRRVLESKAEGDLVAAVTEMAQLRRRSALIHRAIRYCTLCALLICTVIAVLFVGVELGKDLSSGVALLFISGMLSLILGLVCFLREISLATERIEKSVEISLQPSQERRE